MNPLQTKLGILDPGLLSLLEQSIEEVNLLLTKFDTNFPTYTDHSIKHSNEVFNIAANLLNNDELANLNSDEIYILSMACILHDIGMCLPVEEIKQICLEKNYTKEDLLIENINQDYIRNVHHELSYDFILKEYVNLKIPNEKYATAIALVAKGHRVVSLDNHELYKTKYFVRNGREFVCLPYLASIIRFADELDITNIRTPKLLSKYYMPDNEVSKLEWEKHIATTQINYTEDKVIFSVNCSSQNILAALEVQFDKIQAVLRYCQKIIRTISNTEERRFSLKIINIEPQYNYIGFDPKGIKFSFNVNNVVDTFIGEDLYADEFVSIREALQNSIDSCRYKKCIFGNIYSPTIDVIIDKVKITFIDNGLGMDEYIVENFFGRLGSSFYEQEKIKDNFEAIGQFGVGVFSYFQLAEYIDIETKTEHNSTLKFRIDKDPKNYFHFYDEKKRSSSGTTITLYLKEEKQEKFKTADYIDYIEKIFTHIEIPIKINAAESEITITNKDFDFNFESSIKEKIKIQYKNYYDKLNIIRFSIDNDEFAGECALVINSVTSENTNINIFSKYDYESFRVLNRRHGYSQIGISQKGVFVNNYASETLLSTIGNINLKKSTKISIHRKSFIDNNYIQNIINQFNIGLIEKVFIEFHQIIPLNKISKISEDFLKDFIVAYSANIKDVLDPINKYLYIDVAIENETIVLSIKEFVEKYDSFILLSKLDDKQKVFNKTNLPIVLSTKYDYDGSYESINRIFRIGHEYVPKIIIIDNLSYQKFVKSNYSDYLTVIKKLNELCKYNEFQEINSDVLFTKISFNKKSFRKYYDSDELIFNINHPFIDYCIRNYDEIIKNSDYLKRLKNTFEIINESTNNYKHRMSSKNIATINELLKPLYTIEEVWFFNIEEFRTVN